MDHAVAPVEADPRVNGYLTVAEFPVLDAPRHGPGQTVTDLDLLAIPWQTVPLDHEVYYLQGHLRANWDQIGHSQINDATLGLLALIEKSGRASHHLGAPR